MKILFDTSYFIPLIRVELNEWSAEKLFKFVEENSDSLEIFYSELSLFEITAKGMKIAIRNSKLTPKDIQIGIDSLRNYVSINQIQLYTHPYIFELAYLCRKIHSDFVDCLIFSTAVCHTDCFATFDHTFINKILKSKKLLNKIDMINPKFMIQFDYLINDPKLLKNLIKIK